MKTNLGTFFGLPRLGAGAVLMALLAFSVSGAKASLVADWVNGGFVSGTAATGVNTTLTTQNFPFSLSQGTQGSVNFYLYLLSGYTASGLTGAFTFTTAGSGSITVNGSSYSAGTYQISPVTLTGGSTIADGGSIYWSIPINLQTGNITFTDVQIDGTITAVPEPVNFALACFGLIFVGGAAGHTLRRKLCPAKVA